MKGAHLWKRILNEGLVFGPFVVDSPLLHPDNKDRDRLIERIIIAPIICAPWQNDIETDGEGDVQDDQLNRFVCISIPFPEFFVEVKREDGLEAMFVVAGEPSEDGTRHVDVLEIDTDNVPQPCAKTIFSFDIDRVGTFQPDSFRSTRFNSSRAITDEACDRIPLLVEQKKKMEQVEAGLTRSVRSLAVVNAGTLLTCLTILGCKNVGLRATPIAPDQAKRAAKRTWRDATYYRYHTLVVRPPGARSDSPAKEIDVMPHHVRRGHFAEYGPEFNKGLLFGKYAGRFYIPPMMVGDKKHGVVEKDYVIASG